MSENLPQKYKSNLFSKLLNKIKTFFMKDKKENETIISDYETFEDTKKENCKKEIINNLKVDIDMRDVHKEHEKKAFMENLTNNPELLENFSIERLEKILQYYLEENNKKREILKNI